MTNVTQLLDSIRDGDREAAEELLPLLYDELRVLAARRLAQEKPGQTLQATALVHEAYIRLVGGKQQKGWENRGHFFAAAAEAMRRILVDRAREKHSLKRGGDRDRLELHEADLAVVVGHEELLAVNDALEKLEESEPLTAQVVKLRCFAGLPMQDIAASLGMSTRTASKHWAFARAWLFKLLNSDPVFPNE